MGNAKRLLQKRFWQRGDVGTVLLLVAIIALVLLATARLTPYPKESATVTGDQFCRPEPIGPDTPTIDLPAYVSRCPGGDDCKDVTILDGTQIARYGGGQKVIHSFVRIKTNVPIRQDYFNGLDCRAGEEDNCMSRNGGAHFKPYGEPTTIGGKKYQLWYPTAETDGDSTSFTGENGKKASIKFYEYGLVVMVHKTDINKGGYVRDNEFIDISGTESNQPDLDRRFWVTDIYKDTQMPPLPEDILKCKDKPGTGIAIKTSITPTPSSAIIDPPQSKSLDKNQLQLEYLLFSSPSGSFNPTSWWTPECKPAIYLYPEKQTQVLVKVLSNGFLTYTDPLYPPQGWFVTAYPDGTIVSNQKQYPYLYYESRIPDILVKKPQTGFVVAYEKLPALYAEVLPKLGLFGNQITEFSDYWKKALPKKPYYFVGVMPEADVAALEPLQISPKPTTIIRVRLYFQGLETPISVVEPTITTPVRNGFTVVEWGGMVKLDTNSPFTCSQ